MFSDQEISHYNRIDRGQSNGRGDVEYPKVWIWKPSYQFLTAHDLAKDGTTYPHEVMVSISRRKSKKASWDDGRYVEHEAGEVRYVEVHTIEGEYANGVLTRGEVGALLRAVRRGLAQHYGIAEKQVRVTREAL